MTSTRLSPEQIETRLETLDGWKVENGKLKRRFQFRNFVEAFGWMSSVALVAESMDHHPDWTNVYDKVNVELMTHDAGAVTGKDFELAAAMDRLAAPFLRQH